MAKGSSDTTTSRKMIVKAAIRIFSAISLGVFWRLAPSTSAIMRSRKVSPGLALTCTTIQSESTRVPPVTAALADDRGGLARDGRLVDRGHALHHVTVARDHVAGLDQHQVALAHLWCR